jgi:uncharacterized membrane protein YeaQ/YmgE (transglycosylase-associated protein family)
MTVLAWIIFGFFVGLVAKLLMPGRDPGGFVITILVGIVGAVIGGWIGQAAGMYGPGEPVGFVMAVIGSMILLMIYRVVTRRNTGVNA